VFAVCFCREKLQARMERPALTPAALEESEGPTELVRPYVGFFSEGVGIRKGKVVVWDGLDRGYTVRLLGKKECVSGVAAADMAFLVNQEEVDARMRGSDGDSSLVHGRGKRRSSGTLAQRVHTKRGPSAVGALHRVNLVNEDQSVAGHACVGGEPTDACASACKKRALSDRSDVRRQHKRERPSTSFMGVCPFWSQGRLL
jgi:hypothetical protein